jgi:hypothetical protein
MLQTANRAGSVIERIATADAWSPNLKALNLSEEYLRSGSASLACLGQKSAERLEHLTMPKPRTPTTVTLRADSGSIAIAGNNSGVLTTTVASDSRPHRPSLDWPTLGCFIIGILSLVIATLAWLLPHTP